MSKINNQIVELGQFFSNPGHDSVELCDRIEEAFEVLFCYNEVDSALVDLENQFSLYEYDFKQDINSSVVADFINEIKSLLAQVSTLNPDPQKVAIAEIVSGRVDDVYDVQ